jgi:hypothetical protein
MHPMKNLERSRFFFLCLCGDEHGQAKIALGDIVDKGFELLLRDKSQAKILPDPQA